MKNESRVETWPLVDVVVLNWNGWQDTVRCLESLGNATYPNYRVVVVDNGSTDDSRDKIRHWAEKALHGKTCDEGKVESCSISWGAEELGALGNGALVVLLKTGHNFGFSGGCNIGIRWALENSSEYVLLLNNDSIVEPTFLEPAVSEAEKDKTIGLVGGKVYFDSQRHKIWSACGYLSKIKGRGVHYGSGENDEGRFNEKRNVEVVSGALMLVPARVVHQVGFLPEKYFFGAEEWEYSLQVRRAGFLLRYVPTFISYHRVGGSHKTFDPKFLYNTYRNKLMFQRVNLSKPFWHLWYCAFRIYVNTLLIIRVTGKRFRKDKDLKASTAGTTVSREIVKRTVAVALEDDKQQIPITERRLEEVSSLALGGREISERT